jgi:predicted membrane protein
METNNSFRDDRPVKNDHFVSSNRVIVGVVLVMLGFFLVLRNMDILPHSINHIIFSWQMLLVTVGLVITLSSGGNRTAGIILMAIGGFFLVGEIFNDIYNVNMFWPSIFIIVGIVFILSKRKGWNSVHTGPISSDDFIDYVHIFSGGERQIVSENFRGGKITAIFGGSEIDLTKAKLAPGAQELEIACVFGGATIIVPDDWNVRIDVVPVLGGFGDSRKLHPGRTIDMSRQLILKGAVVFGGGEVKSY